MSKQLDLVTLRHFESLKMNGEKKDAIDPTKKQRIEEVRAELIEEGIPLALPDRSGNMGLTCSPAVRTYCSLLELVAYNPRTVAVNARRIIVDRRIEDIPGGHGGTQLYGPAIDEFPYVNIIADAAKIAHKLLKKDGEVDFKKLFPFKVNGKKVKADTKLVNEQALSHFSFTHAFLDSLMDYFNYIPAIMCGHAPYTDMVLFKMNNLNVLEYLADNGGLKPGEYSFVRIRTDSTVAYREKRDFEVSVKLGSETFPLESGVYVENLQKYRNLKKVLM